MFNLPAIISLPASRLIAPSISPQARNAGHMAQLSWSAHNWIMSIPFIIFKNPFTFDKFCVILVSWESPVSIGLSQNLDLGVRDP